MNRLLPEPHTMPHQRLAPAKINLFLNLVGPRSDGFHELVTIMHPVALSDVVTVTTINDVANPPITLTTTPPQLTTHPEQNSVVQAYTLFFKQQKQHPPIPLHVDLQKHIPTQAGLGGGSADAATMLLLLNELTHQPYSQQELLSLGGQLGSDVPFFLMNNGHPTTTLATGRGEMVQALERPIPSGLPILLIKPKANHVSTPEAYQWVRERQHYQTQPVEHFLSALNTGKTDASTLNTLIWNDFETPVYQHLPPLAQLVQQLKALGLSIHMSGSGSALFSFLTPLQTESQTQLSAQLDGLPIDYWFTHTL